MDPIRRVPCVTLSPDRGTTTNSAGLCPVEVVLSVKDNSLETHQAHAREAAFVVRDVLDHRSVSSCAVVRGARFNENDVTLGISSCTVRTALANGTRQRTVFAEPLCTWQTPLC